MPSVKVQTPDGKIITVEVPEGTTQEQIFAFVKSQSQAVPQQQLQQQAAPNQQDIINQSTASIERLQGDIDRLNQVRNNPDLLESVFGGMEGLVSLASAPAAAIASGVAGLADAANPFAEEGAGAARQKQVQEALTFEPRLQSGRGAVGNAANAMQAAAQLGTDAVAIGTAGIEGAIPGRDIVDQASSFQRISEQGVGETMGRDVTDMTGSPLLGTAARILPDALMSATAIKKAPELNSKFGQHLAKKTKPTEFKNLSASQKQKIIAEEIRTGNPNIESVTEFINAKGKVAVSKESRVALKELSENIGEIKASQAVSVFERMSEGSKKRVQQIINKVKKTTNEPLSLERPSDVLGDSIAFRARDVARINKDAGKRIGDIAKSLKNQAVDISAPKQKFFDSMSELGVTFKAGEDGWVTADFSRSKFVGGSQKDMNVLINDLLNNNIGFESAHIMKRSIRDNLKFDAIGPSKVGSGVSEKILKDLSSGIDEVLDATSEGYNKANIDFAKTKEAVDIMQKMAGKDVDLFSDTASKVLANKAKRITSNAVSGPTIAQDILALDKILKDFKIKYTDDVQSLIFATNEIERIFNIAPPNALKGNMLSAGSELARGNIPLAETANFVKKAMSPSEKKVFLRKIKVLEDLIKSNTGKK